jgi:hypothetical protein
MNIEKPSTSTANPAKASNVAEKKEVTIQMNNRFMTIVDPDSEKKCQIS